MPLDSLPEIMLREFMSSPSGKKLQQIMDTVAAVQRRLVEIAENEDSRQFDILKISTVFQIFLIDILAAGKTPAELTNDDWKTVAEKVYQYAILADGQSYSTFVFALYADYIDLSVKVFTGRLNETRLQSIEDLSADIRSKSVMLDCGEISEVKYIEDCLWISLEAMFKLMSSWLATALLSNVGSEYIQLAEAISDLGFEYGRYVLYAKEQAILNAYIERQYILDEELQCQYEAFMAELQEQEEQFQGLIDAAFSPDFRDSLMRSASLARAAGVKEEEILSSMEDIDAYFLE